MKYAREVGDLLAAYPGREFRMVQIVRYVSGGRPMERRQRHAMKIAVWRVLHTYAEAGLIDVRPPNHDRGGPAFYAWKVSHAALA